MIQFIYPYYENPNMLFRQLTYWAAYDPIQKNEIKIILIDDGSPRNPAKDVLDNSTCIDDLNIELYRIKENIPWNQNGAHNLGFHVASSGWCLTSDIDHVLPASQLTILQRLISSGFTQEGNHHTFARRRFGYEDELGYKRHPNSYLLTKKLFWHAGGYDEDFSGYYGSDCTFREGLKRVSNRVEFDPEPYLLVFDENDIEDANTREWGRKDSKYYSVNHKHLVEKRRRWQRPTSHLRFDWERVT